MTAVSRNYPTTVKADLPPPSAVLTPRAARLLLRVLVKAASADQESARGAA